MRDEKGMLDVELGSKPVDAIDRPPSTPRSRPDRVSLAMLIAAALLVPLTAVLASLASDQQDERSRVEQAAFVAGFERSAAEANLDDAREDRSHVEQRLAATDEWTSSAGDEVAAMRETLRTNPPAAMERRIAVALREERASRARADRLEEQADTWRSQIWWR